MGFEGFVGREKNVGCFLFFWVGGGYIPYMEPMGVESYKFVTCSCLKDATEAMACCMKNDSFSTFQVWDCFFFFFGAWGTWGNLVSKPITSHITCFQGATLVVCQIFRLWEGVLDIIGGLKDDDHPPMFCHDYTGDIHGKAG